MYYFPKYLALELNVVYNKVARLHFEVGMRFGACTLCHVNFHRTRQVCKAHTNDIRERSNKIVLLMVDVDL